MVDAGGGFSFVLQTEDVERRVKKVPRDLVPRARTALRDIGNFHTNAVRKKMTSFSKHIRSGAQGPLQRRTGTLFNAIDTRGLGASLDDLRQEMFVGTKYALIQEKGGTIRPRRSKYLTVPTEAALTPGGALSGRAKIRRSGNGYTTDLGDTFIFRGKSGGLFIGIKGQERADGSPIAFYVLKSEVTIPPRLQFIKTFRDETRDFAIKRMRKAMRDSVRDSER